MLKLCALFAFVLAVVCEEDSEVEAQVLGKDNGDGLVVFFQTEIPGRWPDLEYNEETGDLAKKFLVCAWRNTNTDSDDSNADSISEVSEDSESNSDTAETDRCREEAGLKQRTILRGTIDGDYAYSLDAMLQNVKDNWQSVEGRKVEEKDPENLQERLKDAEGKGEKKVGCAYFYEKSMWDPKNWLGDVERLSNGQQGAEEQVDPGAGIGDFVCVFST